MKTILLATFAVLLAGCSQGTTQEQLAEYNKAHVYIEPNAIFEKDGCTGYRFYDSNQYRFYVVCGKKPVTTSSEWSESCGKNCTRHITQSITTVSKE